MSSAQKEKQEIPLCSHIRNFLIRFLYRAKPVSGIERALRTRPRAISLQATGQPTIQQKGAVLYG